MKAKTFTKYKVTCTVLHADGATPYTKKIDAKNDTEAHEAFAEWKKENPSVKGCDFHNPQLIKIVTRIEILK